MRENNESEIPGCGPILSINQISKFIFYKVEQTLDKDVRREISAAM